MKYDITIANLTRSYVERETPDTFTPLGALYIASTLEKNDYNVDFRDYLTKDHNRYGDPTSPGSIFDFLEDSADILGISCGGSMLPSLLPALKILKTRYPHKTIILGGIGASGVAAELLHEFPFINIVAIGEGEETMLDLANHLCNGKGLNDVKGIIYRDNGTVCINPPRGRINDLDAVPFPNYDKIDFEDYSVISLITSRGCPYRCSFCDVAPFWGRRNCKRDLENIIAEMRLLAWKYKQKRIEIVDDTFTIDKKRVLAFCKKLQEKKLGITWSCFSRADTIDTEMMTAMSDSGCVLIFYGLESGSGNILNGIEKQISRERAMETILKSKKQFDVMASLMWGFPFETMDDFHETLTFFKYISGVASNTYLFSVNPFPLSELYRQYGKHIEFTEEWGREMGGLAKKEIMDLVKKHPRIFPGFYHYVQEGFAEKVKILRGERLLSTFMSCWELCSNEFYKENSNKNRNEDGINLDEKV